MGMPKVCEGKLDAKGLSFGIVVSRFNDFVTSRLLEGCLDALVRHGADDKKIRVAWVPGTFEIPLIAKKLAAKGGHSAVICLGALIRGSTPHFDYLALPIINGVITCDTLEQAIERAGTKAGNKGFDAGEAAIEMANLVASL
jgi:6,7-dimethyl-8-ribityllumazine synthase